MRSNLQPRQLLVLMDFTAVPLTVKIGAPTVVQDCVIVCEHREQDGTIVRRNFDFLCAAADTNKHDYFFVLQVWVDLFLKLKLNQQFGRIDVWSDGGPHHFKTRFCQFMWHALSELRFDHKRITHHFFASYHGHSLADGHARHIKCALDRAYKISQLQRYYALPGATFGPASVGDMAEVIRHNCKDTQVTVYDSIERQEHKPNVSSINSIKAMHCFVYEGGVCAATEKTGDDPNSRTLFEF